MVYLQDGVEFFEPLQGYIGVTILEQGTTLDDVRGCIYWITCELMESVYNLCVERHGRSNDYERIFYVVRSKWTEMEKVFHAVFRVPVARWLDTHIELSINGRDLYLSPYKEP